MKRNFSETEAEIYNIKNKKIIIEEKSWLDLDSSDEEDSVIDQNNENYVVEETSMTETDDEIEEITKNFTNCHGMMNLPEEETNKLYKSAYEKCNNLNLTEYFLKAKTRYEKYLTYISPGLKKMGVLDDTKRYVFGFNKINDVEKVFLIKNIDYGIILELRNYETQVYSCSSDTTEMSICEISSDEETNDE